MNSLDERSNNKLSKSVTNFVCKFSKPYDENDDCVKEPYAFNVNAGKSSAIYNAHSYHTKVPPKGIAPFIIHYTNPGDVILDSFCGTGMTGVAALLNNRNVLLIDISPSASFIAQNYCTPFNRQKFISVESKIRKEMQKPIDWLYETQCEKCGRKSEIEYTIWSDVFRCPRCYTSFSLWEISVIDENEIKKKFKCPSCMKNLDKAKCEKVGNVPIKLFINCPKCKRQNQRLTEFDLKRIEEIESKFRAVYEEGFIPKDNLDKWPIDKNKKPLWYPSNRIPDGDKTRECINKGITHVNQIYTTRNLWAVAKLWDLIVEVEDERIKKLLQFVFTSFNPSLVSKLTRYNFGKRGNGPLSGTLYIPSFSVERNILSIWDNKKKSIIKLSSEIHSRAESLISNQSATDLSNVPSCSIDYVFTDPPFGSNLMYSELNFVWESWLGDFTATKNEAIMNKTQGKGVEEYKILMSESFMEIYRVLKPGRWMTLVFHNSSGEVWQAIQDGLSQSGFSVAMIGIFDKKQRSFNQVTSSGAVGYDVVINCYKPKETTKNGINGKTTGAAIIGFVADQLLTLPLIHSDNRTARKLHSKTIGYFMLKNKSLWNLSFDYFQQILRNNFREIDGHWYLPFQRPRIGGQKRLFGYISNEAEAIAWLEDFLKVPKKYGDIPPRFFKALGSNKLQKDLETILVENFVKENEVWRNPTKAEKDHLTKKLTDKTARQIASYLEGISDTTPTDEDLCEWIEFCYNNHMFQEGSKLFYRLNESEVSPEEFKKAKKIAEICKLKSWEGS